MYVIDWLHCRALFLSHLPDMPYWGKWLTQSLLVLHLLGIAFWLGALLPFHWICLQTDTTNLRALAHRFGLVALVYVGLIIITGLAYAYILLENSLLFSRQATVMYF